MDSKGVFDIYVWSQSDTDQIANPCDVITQVGAVTWYHLLVAVLR